MITDKTIDDQVKNNINQKIKLTRGFDFLSIRNVGLHTAINVRVFRYKCSNESDCIKDLNLSLDMLIPGKVEELEVIEKKGREIIILPFGLIHQISNLLIIG